MTVVGKQKERDECKNECSGLASETKCEQEKNRKGAGAL
jgi:hypothetical protein